MKTKRFPLRTVLTVTTGRLLTQRKGPHDNGIGDLYEILNYLTGDNLFTHQLPRAGDICKPWLLECFPELECAGDANDLKRWIERDGEEHGINNWLAELQATFPEIKDSYEVSLLPEGWTTIDPRIELESMVGKDKIIAI